jgi:hypothetical protein
MNATRDETRFASVDGRKLLLDWTINRHLFQTFEIETGAVEGALPDALDPVEVRPGISLLSVGILRYEGGHFGPESPEFDEVVAAIHVPGDLSVAMPVPDMSFYAIAVFTDSPEFVAQEEHTIYTPAYHVPSLEVSYGEDGFSVDVRDERGPILSLRGGDRVEPVFSRVEMWGQHYTSTKGLHHGIWEWDGRRFEHMRPSRDWLLSPHPLFEAIDVTRVVRCYRQMALEPGTLCRERFYGMRPLGNA